MIPTSIIKYVLALGLIGSPAVSYGKKPFVAQESTQAFPTIEECSYNETEKLDLNKIMETVDISEKYCAQAVVARYALDFLNKKTATVDYNHAKTTKIVYKVNDLIAEALQNDSFRRAVVDADRDYSGKVDYKEAKTLADFLKY